MSSKRVKILARIEVQDARGKVTVLQEDRGKPLAPEQHAALEDAYKAIARFAAGSGVSGERSPAP